MINPTDLLTETDAYNVRLCKDRNEWLIARQYSPNETITFGGSDAGAICDCSSFKTARELFAEKRRLLETGEIPAGFTNERTERGKAEEPLIRQLFAIEHPLYDVYDPSGVVFYSKQFPYMSASIDGILINKRNGKRGVLEIKSCEWSNKWRGGALPNDYRKQVEHYLTVTGFEFAILKARIIGFNHVDEREYFFDVNEQVVADEMAALQIKEQDFYERVMRNEAPPFVIPFT